MLLARSVSRLVANSRRLLVGLCTLSLAVGMACDTESTGSVTSATPTVEPTAVDTFSPVTVTDSDGREIVFDEPPERIVAYDSVTVEVLYAIGEGQRIVGTHDFATYPPGIDEVPRVGSFFDVSIEKMVELDPDLVNIWFSSSVPALENAGQKVLYLSEPEDIDGISERMRLWGKITGSVRAGEEAAKTFESRIEQLRARIASLEQGPRIFHDASAGFWTAGPDTLVGQVYDLLKAQNIAHEVSGYAQLSREVIVERDPELIITAHPDLEQAYYDDPALTDVAAVRDKRIETIDPDIISVAGPRYADAIEQLARLIYPDLFQ